MWIVYLTFSKTNQKVLSLLAEFYHERAVSPYLFSHSRKIPGGWKENEHGSLEIISAPPNSNPLAQLKKTNKQTHQRWLAWLCRTKKRDTSCDHRHSAEECGINTEAYWNRAMSQQQGYLPRYALRLKSLCPVLWKNGNASFVVGHEGMVRKCESLRGWDLES